MRPTPLPKLLFCDGYQLILDIVGSVLRQAFDVLPVSSSEDCLKAAETFATDVVLLDIDIRGDDDGFTVAKKLQRIRPSLPVVFLSMHAKPDYIQRAIEVGAKAYVSKSASADALLSCLRAVLNGESFVAASTVQLFSTMQGALPGYAHDSLTKRQCQVLRLIARGYTTRAIAKELKTSFSTADFHRRNIMERLNLRSTAEMTRYALANNLG